MAEVEDGDDDTPVFNATGRVSLNERELNELRQTEVRAQKPEQEGARVRPDGPAGPIAVEQSAQFRVGRKASVPSETLACSLSAAGDICAVCCLDGRVRAFRRQNGACMQTLELRNAALTSSGEHVATVARMKPEKAEQQSQGARSISLLGTTQGTVAHWHPPSNSIVGATMHEPNNKVYTVAWRPADAHTFASAGKDRIVRLYDEERRSLIQSMHGGDGVRTGGHANAIYALRYTRTSQNSLITGGADQTLQLWDTRVGHSVRSISGPLVQSDNQMDVKENTVITASNRDKNQLQLWDLGSGKLIRTLEHGPAQGGPQQVRPTGVQLLGHEFDGFCLLAAGPEARIVQLGSGAVRARARLSNDTTRSLDAAQGGGVAAYTTTGSVQFLDLPET